jgi:hypothetical protein
MVKFYRKLELIAVCYGTTFNNTTYKFVHKEYSIICNTRNHLMEIKHKGDTIYRCADPKYYTKRYPRWYMQYNNKSEIKQLVETIYNDLLLEEEGFAKAGLKC